MRYLLILAGFFRASAIADLEYRLNIAVKVFTDILWYSAQIAVFEVLFHNAKSISGWTLESTRVFLGILFVVDALWMVLFSENLDRISEKVRRGDIDLLLTKPINSQFMLSFQRLNTSYVLNIALTLIWLTWSLIRLDHAFIWTRLLLLIILIPCSLAIVYGIRFLFSVTALIFTQAENINYVWYQIYRLGTRPDSIYPPWLRYTILTIIPVGFVASVPARLILGEQSYELIAASIGLAATSVFLSRFFWKFALRFYSSASS
jgi:ABC-2 type transport system permease protein